MWTGIGKRVGFFRMLKIGVTVFSVLVILVVSYLLLKSTDPSAILSKQDNRLTMALILLGFFVFKALTVVVVESTFLYIAAGVFFPLEEAIFIVVLGLSIEALINFHMGRLIGRKHVHILLNKLQGRKPMLDRMLVKMQGSDPFLIFMMRMLPGFHNGLTGLVLGASGNSLLVYMPASLLGMLPKAIATTLMGESILDPLSPMFILSLLFYLLSIAFAFALQHHMRGRSVDRFVVPDNGVTSPLPATENDKE